MRRLNGGRVDDAGLRQESLGKAVTLVCLSHLRWNFVWQRPQHLLSRAAADYDTYFIEEPVFELGAKPEMRWRREPSGVNVGTPVLPEGCTPSSTTVLQRRLLDEFLRRRPRGQTVPDTMVEIATDWPAVSLAEISRACNCRPGYLVPLFPRPSQMKFCCPAFTV